MYLDLLSRLGGAAADESERRFGVRPASAVPSLTPRYELGDLAFSFPFEVAKRAGGGLKPRDVAEALKPALAAVEGVRRVEVAGGGYLNVALDRARFARALFAAVRARAPLGRPLYAGKTLIEHTNINPNKAAHIGHLRNAVLGDTLARALRALGHEVEVQNYIDDTGVQVADVVVGFQQIERLDLAAVERLAASPERPFDHVCWDLYARVGQWYAEDPARERHRQEVLHGLEQGGNPTAALADGIARRVVEAHLRTVGRLGIRYDLLAWEGDILRLGLWARTFERLRATPAVYLAEEGKNKGCWMMRLEGTQGFEGLEDADKVLVRSNGTATYVAKDIAYQMWKFGLSAVDFGYALHRRDADGHELWTTTSDPAARPPRRFGHAARVYNVIDVRQSYLQEIVARGLEAAGHPEAARSSVHYAYEMVALTPRSAEELGFALSPEERRRPYVEMSGRRGLGVKADDLFDRLAARAGEEVRARHAELPPEGARALALEIAVGALRYFMLRYGRTKVVAFDVAEALQFQGETGPYLQNSLVRCRSIFRKAGEREGLGEEAVEALDPERDLGDLSELEREDEAWDLVFHLARVDEILAAAVSTLELSLLAKWAFQNAQRFHKYYERYRIVGEEAPARRRERAAVVHAYERLERRVLEVMGTPVPERM